jgi:biotin carboxyl carrier protein
MKYEIETDGQTFSVELSDESGQGVAIIDGSPVEFDLNEPEPGIYTLLIANQVLEARTVGNATQTSLDVILRGRRIQLRITDPRRRRRGALTVAGKIELKATMPGRVVRWLCQPGDGLSEGQGVVVLEAMKMQNEVRSPKSGTITDIRVKPGQTVETGAVLAVIE